MTRQEFMERVRLPLGRLTAEERENICRELEEHLEDRMEVLLDMGWSEDLAEARSLEAMGAPAEIGREMARQYPGRWWLWLGRAAVLLTVVVCVQALLGIGILCNAWDSLAARIYPQLESDLNRVEAEERVNLRMDMGNDVLRVFRVSIGERDGQRVAEISLCAYDRWPFGIVALGWQNCVRLSASEREAGFNGGNGRGSYGADYCHRYVELAPEDRSVVLTYSRYGETARLEIPLPERGETA